MAQVHYLDWQSDEADADTPEARFFLKMNIMDADGVSEVPEAWYKSVAELSVDSCDALWEAWQGDIKLEETEFTSDEVRRSHERFMELREQYGLRNMSAGDIIEVDGVLHLVSAVGFTEVEWGEEPEVNLTI